MADMYKGKIPIIKRSLDEGWLRGVGSMSFGCIPRDFSVDPVAMGDSPSAMKLVDPSEYDARWEEDEANESSLEHLFLRGDKPAFELLDQDGFPDCWAHSSPHAMMLDRLKQHLPVVRFNGVAIATLLKQLNGGWCGLSMKFLRENGAPEVGTGPGQWPYQSRHGKDTPELRANMALHKDTSDWYDLGKQEYNQTLTQQQLYTCSFENWAMAADWNRFSHSMCLVRIVRVEKGVWAPLVLQSWKGWGYYGLGVLLDFWPDNAVAIRSSTPSAT